MCKCERDAFNVVYYLYKDAIFCARRASCAAMRRRFVARYIASVSRAPQRTYYYLLTLYVCFEIFVNGPVQQHKQCVYFFFCIYIRLFKSILMHFNSYFFGPEKYSRINQNKKGALDYIFTDQKFRVVFFPKYSLYFALKILL